MERENAPSTSDERPKHYVNYASPRDHGSNFVTSIRFGPRIQNRGDERSPTPPPREEEVEIWNTDIAKTRSDPVLWEKFCAPKPNSYQVPETMSPEDRVRLQVFLLHPDTHFFCTKKLMRK